MTLNATLPAKVAAFEIEATPPPSSDITLSATLPPKTASFAVEPVGHVSLAATLLAKTAAFDVLAVPPPGEMYLSATLAAKTAAFTLASGPGTLLLTGLNTPRRLAADETDLYIAESHSLNPQQPQPSGTATSSEISRAMAISASFRPSCIDEQVGCTVSESSRG